METEIERLKRELAEANDLLKEYDQPNIAALRKMIEQGELELAELQSKWDYVVADERECCHEHVGFREYIQNLTRELAEAQTRYLDLLAQFKPDYSKPHMCEGKMEVELEIHRLREQIATLTRELEETRNKLQTQAEIIEHGDYAKLTRDKERNQAMLQRYEEKYGKLETD